MTNDQVKAVYRVKYMSILEAVKILLFDWSKYNLDTDFVVYPLDSNGYIVAIGGTQEGDRGSLLYLGNKMIKYILTGEYLT